MALIEKITIGQDDGFRVEARPAFRGGGEDLWDLTLWQQGSSHGATVQIEIEGVLEAERVAEKLYALLRPHADAKHARDEVRYARQTADLAERSKRRKDDRNRKVEKAKKKQEPVDIRVCGECLYASPDLDEWDMAIHECSSCGNVQQSDKGNRCSQCNRFMSKVADRSCPECGSLEKPDQAKALRLDDGDYEIIEEPKPPTTLRPLAKIQTLSAAQGGHK